VDPLFTPKAVEGQRPWIEHWVTRLINDIVETGKGDFSRDLGTPLTSIYTMKAAGLPIEDWSDYAHVVQSSIAGSSSAAPRTPGVDMLHLRQRVAEEIRVQRQQPLQEGLISHLITTAVEDRKLDDWEIEAYVWLLIFGGVDTTQACMGSAFVWLARNPERRQSLADHPDLMVDAALRVFTPSRPLHGPS
jgi:cytochrome P450